MHISVSLFETVLYQQTKFAFLADLAGHIIDTGLLDNQATWFISKIMIDLTEHNMEKQNVRK